MSQMIFDSHVNNDIEDALQYIFAADKNAIPDFLKKIQGIEQIANSGTSAPLCTNRQAGYKTQENEPNYELIKQLTITKEENNRLSQQLRQINEEYENIKEKSSRLSDLNEEQVKQNDKLLKEIEELNNEKLESEKLAQEYANDVDIIKKKLDDSIKNYEIKINEQKKLTNDLLQKKEEELTEAHLTEIKNLQTEIKNLRKKLEQYEPQAGSTGEIKYFDVNGNCLDNTLFENVPYVGRVLTDNTICYQFNTEKGKALEAIQNRDSILDPFCDVIDVISKGNSIQPVEWGTLKEVGGTYVITKKAKIKIVYQ